MNIHPLQINSQENNLCSLSMLVYPAIDLNLRKFQSGVRLVRVYLGVQ